jgi:adenylyl-sulfate kinase
MPKNVFKQDYNINSNNRARQKNQKPLMMWLTGLSGSGKSTIANLLDIYLNESGFHTYCLDGDNIRTGINNNLGFSKEDREENLRRVGEIGKLMNDAGLICIAAFISPLQKDRDLVKNIIGSKNFIEIFIDTPLEICEKRDVKGLYAKARKGEINNFTGISAPYEAPLNPDITIKTDEMDAHTAAKKIIDITLDRIKL